MNIEQKQRLVNQFEQFWDLDLDKRVAETHKDFQDLSTVYIGYYTVLEFTLFSKKAVSQLGQMLQSSLSNILPFQYQFQNDFGSGNLSDDLTNYIVYCASNDFNNAVTHLYRLVYYQVQNGFWDTDQPLDKKKKTENIVELENKLNLIAEQLNKNIELNKTLIDELTSEKERIQQLIITKNKELDEISSLIPTARTESSEITKLLTNSTDNSQAITGLLNQQKSNLDDLKIRLDEEKLIYASFEKDVKELKDSLQHEIEAANKTNSEFNSLLKTVSDKSRTFDERLIVLNELIGKEGAVKLFNTFNDRKKELDKPIKKWANYVFLTGCISLIVIVAIFTNIFGLVGGIPTMVDWHYLIINSLKSLPVMIVLFFTIKQYGRERSFQEEYAFRSAIALTVQAYSDLAGSRKEDLIAKAVENIYNLPSVMKEGPGISWGFKGKLLNETLKNLNETIKTIKG